MKIILQFMYANGWGDTFLSIFDILNFTDYIKKTHPEMEIIFQINNINNVNVLDKVLNIDFLNSYFHKFKILNTSELALPVNGIITYENETFKRIYSGRNPDPLNNIPGVFDVFVQDSDYEHVKNLNIPYLDFTFNDLDSRPKDFNIFNENIVTQANEFITNNFKNEDFYSIYYRALVPINESKLNNFKTEMMKILDSSKNYFICSNSGYAKKVFLELPYKIIPYRDLNNHDLNHIPNGFMGGDTAITDALFAVTELLLLSKSKHIYYSGDITSVSLFNWYSINIKNVELTSFLI